MSGKKGRKKGALQNAMGRLPLTRAVRLVGRGEFERACEVLELEALLEAALSNLEKMRGWLRENGAHTYRCKLAWDAEGKPYPVRCVCGLQELLSVKILKKGGG